MDPEEPIGPAPTLGGVPPGQLQEDIFQVGFLGGNIGYFKARRANGFQDLAGMGLGRRVGHLNAGPVFQQRCVIVRQGRRHFFKSTVDPKR